MIIFQKEFGYGEQYRGNFRHQRYQINAHIHQFCEIIYVLEGEMDITVDGKKYKITPRHAAVITPFQIHEVRTIGVAKFWMCVFSNNCVPNYSVDIEFFHNRESSVFKTGNALSQQIEELFTLFNHPMYISEGEVPRKIKSVLYSVFSEYTEAVPDIIKFKKRDALSSLLLYLNEHYLEDINLSSVGKALGYNPKYLSQCLSVIPNMSFTTILNSLRIDYAKKLLLNTNFKIIDIAYEAGFESEQSFHRVFLKIAGSTPGEYRKTRTKNKSITK